VWPTAAVAAVGALALIGSAAVGAPQDRKRNPYTGDPKAIEEGKALFLEVGCIGCHGHEAEGATGPSLTDDQWRYVPTDETLYRAISNGRAGTLMPPWKDKLSPDEIWKVIAFIRSLYKGDPAKIVW
jgi:cytochrome c(L)